MSSDRITWSPDIRGAGIAGLCLLIAVLLFGSIGEAQAAEVNFCWGKKLNNKNDLCMNGTDHYMYGVSGKSNQQRTCVGLAYVTGSTCSKAPGEAAYKAGNGQYTQAVIVNWGAGPGTFYGTFWTGAAPPTPPKAWNYDTIAMTTNDEPAVSSRSSGSLDVFVRNTSGQLVRRAWTGSSWSSSEVVAQAIASGPSSVSWSASRIDVVARMADDSVGHWYCVQCTPGATIWYYDNLGATIAGKPAVSSWGPGRLDIFARGKVSNGLLHKWWWDPVGYVGWENHGGPLYSSPDAVSWGVNRVDVVAQGAGNTILQAYWTGSQWLWNNLGGNITDAPSVSSWEPGRVDVWGRDAADGSLVHRWWNGIQWVPWEDHGGFIPSGPDAVSWGKERIDVVGAGAGALAHWYYG